jgi:hypothetical protein
MFYCWLRGFLGHNFGLCFDFRSAVQCVTYFLCNLNGNRTGVCLFLGYAKPGQQVNNRLGFDLQLSGQFINSNLG